MQFYNSLKLPQLTDMKRRPASPFDKYFMEVGIFVNQPTKFGNTPQPEYLHDLK